MLRQIALALLIALSPYAIAYGEDTPKASTTRPKVLHGAVSDCGIFTEELQAKMGLGIARVKGKLVVALVMDGMGKSAGFKEGDVLLDANIKDNVISLKAERAGVDFERRIDLATGLVPTLPVSVVRDLSARADAGAGLDSQKVAPSFKKYVGLLLHGDGWAEQRQKVGNYSAGWTPQALHDNEVWVDEYHKQGVDRPLMQAWRQKFIESNRFFDDYMQKYWPDDVIGWLSYHIVFDRAGNVLEYHENPHSVLHWVGNPAAFNGQAGRLIDFLGKSHVLACPPASKVERFQAGIEIEVYHDAKTRR